MGKRISYTQVSMFTQCPHRWKTNYVDKISKREGSIHLIFGTAMHEVLQNYFTIMYEHSVKAADAFDSETFLYNRLVETFKKDKETSEVFEVTQEEMVEFYNDGLAILDFFKKRRGEYFSKRGYELIGCEVPVDLDLPNNLKWIGYLDLVIKDTVHDVIKIYDIKTSTMGWNKWMKMDKGKTDQLLYYKQFYSKMYNHPIDKIEVEFFIVKRKLYEKVDFPQKRIQKFAPASGKPSINKAMGNLKVFVNAAFTEDGEYIEGKSQPTNPSKKNCKWCEFKNTEYCSDGI